MAGGGTEGALRSLPTQTFLGFSDKIFLGENPLQLSAWSVVLMEEGNIRASPFMHKNVFIKPCEVSNLAKFACFQSILPRDVTNIVLLFV